MQTLALDRLIAELALAHDGLIPTNKLYAAGHCREAIHARLRIKALVDVRRGVRGLAVVPLTPARHGMAAALVTPGSWVSHTSALAIHGAIIRPGSLHPEISCDRRVRLDKIRTHQMPYPGKANLTTHFEIPVSRPWLAIIESAAVLSEDELAVATDSLVQHKLVSLKRLQRAHTEASWYPGRIALNQILDDRLNGLGLVRSFLEQDLSNTLRKHGLPSPTRNLRITLPNGRHREIDVAWPELRVGLEAQSWQYHSNTSDWGRTMIRDRELTAFGWTLLPVVVADTRDPTSLLDALSQVLVSAVA
jgi:hypothetical protein